VLRLRSVDELREAWKQGPQAVGQLYGGRPLEFGAVISYRPGQTYVTLEGLPPIICHMAPGWSAAGAVFRQPGTVTAQLQGVDSAGMHLSHCRINPPN
jgi:hypothetical protein